MDTDPLSSAHQTPCSEHKPWVDPILAEIDAYREAHAAQFDYDVVRMLQDVQSRAEMLVATPCPSESYSVPTNPEGSFSYEDPIITELDTYREQQAARFGYDFGPILKKH